MPQFSQIRERFLANARQHLLSPSTTVCECKLNVCLNTLACRTIETSLPLGNPED
ncbi:MAG: hypothetical protein IPN98_18625 [Propionivibrio sp.]|nr:hypothetical protein [Propionivibrio sp.]